MFIVHTIANTWTQTAVCDGQRERETGCFEERVKAGKMGTSAIMGVLFLLVFLSSLSLPHPFPSFFPFSFLPSLPFLSFLPFFLSNSLQIYKIYFNYTLCKNIYIVENSKSKYMLIWFDPYPQQQPLFLEV